MDMVSDQHVPMIRDPGKDSISKNSSQGEPKSPICIIPIFWTLSIPKIRQCVRDKNVNIKAKAKTTAKEKDNKKYTSKTGQKITH